MTWNPPTDGWLKCNLDATFNYHCGITNRDWCVCDNLWSFIIAGVAWDTGSLSVIEVEVMALKKAILEAVELHLENVIFESDSQRVVQVIHSNHNGGFGFNFIITSIKALLHDSPNFEVEFIKRRANLIAHSLARAANSWSRCNRFNLIPPCIEQVLINELHLVCFGHTKKTTKRPTTSSFTIKHNKLLPGLISSICIIYI